MGNMFSGSTDKPAQAPGTAQAAETGTAPASGTPAPGQGGGRRNKRRNHKRSTLRKKRGSRRK